ncbi:D-alanyl-D-alanine carboxypeptidase [Acrocarpospora pleiomorpha]|uniref:D-alanyl-D-alanine carboxypeptidase n=1 Tax=Acrocarpospora pleiomorpha TaxID=90975 RepID=A0A5M3Y714_9ACTN|nr:D-alanyl-D-alanine carboxypeptidase/D-alanyl-D-alanine-endopeptidase [Acrocarpospora pleiomorpha]GES27488.1 D-alanyl-D-alanine carboxypeptidase [Acrocarpospora pleiomorpha]
MVRRERWVLLFTLALLQAFAIAVGVYVIVHGTEQLPASIAAPKPTPTPIVTAGPVLDPAADGPLPAKGTLAALLGDAMGDPAIGGNLAGAVLDTETGETLFDSAAATALAPASTTKVVTGVAALASVGADTKLVTKVIRSGATSIALVGGGDPTLAGPKADPKERVYPRPASLATLASRTARALKDAGTTSVSLRYDASLFDGPKIAPGWKPTYVPEGSAAPVTALAIDEGRVSPKMDARSADPPRAAALAFADLLEKQGIKVNDNIRPGTAKPTSPELARVESAPIYQLVERMLTISDNDLAEALARQVAISEKLPHTFVGQAQAVHQVLARLGADQGVEVHDGSGLSTQNRITPAALAKLVALSASPAHPELHTLVSGLPVAGYTGTLHDRYDESDSRAGAGLVRAKTGTLNGVNTLTGLVYTMDGRLLSFAFMANDVANPAKTIEALDKLAAIVSRAA